MDYFTHNARTLAPVSMRTREPRNEREANYMLARDVCERRTEGERTWKRGHVNDMPYYVYSPRARRAVILGVRS